MRDFSLFRRLLLPEYTVHTIRFLKKTKSSWPLASNLLTSFSIFFFTLGGDNFGNKIPLKMDLHSDDNDLNNVQEVEWKHREVQKIKHLQL